MPAKLFEITNHPVCAAKERDLLIESQPPLLKRRGMSSLQRLCTLAVKDLPQRSAQGFSRRYVQFETKERCGCTIGKANPIMVDISSTRLNDFHDYAFSATVHSQNRYDNMVVQVEVRFARLKRCITQSETS
jgi:hypothetical protein